jgi:deazaflavin-dependent oxidoreductase (nitroreductase family)
MVKSLLRVGVPLNGPGKVPMYLLTVQGRKSGQPRTTPVAVVEQDGKRYLFAPYGVVDWVRNVRAAGDATFTRRRRSEQMRAIELPIEEARPVLTRFRDTGNPVLGLFGISRSASPEDVERLLADHPIFLLRSSAAAIPAVSEAA